MLEEDPQSYERVLSSMCTEPHPAATAAAHRFLATNPGDPATYPGVATLEAEVIERLGEIAGLSTPHGYVATGGTEGNIQALHIARNRAETEQPNVVVPESGHFSFRKAAELLDVEFRESALDEAGRADPAAMAERIDGDTVMLAAVAGSTEYGRVDPIPEIADVAADHDAHCHVDAAWGGFVLPFRDRAWNFGDAPLDTLTIDPHKFGRAAIPSGGLLARSESLLNEVSFDTPYLESGTQITLSGTRSGAGVASAAAALSALWPDGYRRQAERAQANAEWIADELADRGFEVVDPTLPLVAADVPEPTFERLRDRGWRIARTAAGELRLVCMPHVTRNRLETFVDELDAVREVGSTAAD